MAIILRAKSELRSKLRSKPWLGGNVFLVCDRMTGSLYAHNVLFACAIALALALAGITPLSTQPARIAWATSELVTQEEFKATINTHEIILSEGQNNFQIEIAVNSTHPYAGAEFALQCGEGITANKVSYSATRSGAGPTVSGGQTWFSYFSGANNFADTVIATVELSYLGSANVNVALNNLCTYTLQGSTVERENAALNEVIVVKRAGATNQPEPLVPPASEPTDSGTSGTLGTGTSHLNSSGTSNVRPASLVALPLNNNNSAEQTGALGASGLPQDNSKANSLSSLANQGTPLSSGIDSSTQAAARNPFEYFLASPLILLTTALLVGCLLLLGYVRIKRRREPSGDYQA